MITEAKTVAVILVISILIPATFLSLSTANNWSKEGYDNSNTAFSPYEIDDFAPWNRTIFSGVGVPAIVDGVAYIGSVDRQSQVNYLYALNASNGKEIWNCSFGYDIFTNPVVSQGVIYIGFNNHDFGAVNASTGQIIWRHQVSTEINDVPNVVDGVLYFGSIDNNVYALNASTGEKIWTYPTGNYVWDICPAIDSGLVFIASNDKNIYALDVATGEKVWSYKTSQQVQMVNPSVAKGMVYFGCTDKYLYALDEATGGLVWRSFINGSPTTCAVYEDMAYVGSLSDTFYAFNASTGSKLWTYNAGSFIEWDPAIGNGVIYFPIQDHHVVALDAFTGTYLYNFTFRDIPHAPVISGGTVFVGVQNGDLCSFKALIPIRISLDGGAIISPQTKVVNYTDNINYAFSAKTNYQITHVYINGVDKGPITSWNFTNVKTPQNVTVVSLNLLATPSPTPNPPTPTPTAIQATTPPTPTAQQISPKPSANTPTTIPSRTAPPTQTFSPTPTVPEQQNTSNTSLLIGGISVLVVVVLAVSTVAYFKKRSK